MEKIIVAASDELVATDELAVLKIRDSNGEKLVEVLADVVSQQGADGLIYYAVHFAFSFVDKEKVVVQHDSMRDRIF